MWIFTLHGFFSVVNTTELQDDFNGEKNVEAKDETIEIRSRYRQHLELLKERFPDQLKDHTIFGYDDPNSEYARRDYEYRIIVTAEEWVFLGALLAADVDYPNFKDEVHQCSGDSKIGETPYMSQLYKVYSAVQNDSRWTSPSTMIN